MMWPFRRQAAEAEQLRDALTELMQHVTDEIAAADAVEMLPRIRHMCNVLRADAEREEAS